jgi:hypothetical protein
VSGHDLTPEDTAAMRATPGDWREYLQSEIDRGRARREAKPQKPVPPPPPGHRPGAWPPGVRPPDPPPPIHPAEVDRAVREYRDWTTAGHPLIDAHCECPACQQPHGGTR